MISINSDNTDIDKGYFTNNFLNEYQLASTKDFNTQLFLPDTLKPYNSLLYKTFGITDNITYIEERAKKIEFEKNKKIVIAFSGGKDCVATTIKAMKQGYKPFLYYINGINRSYTYEKTYAQESAQFLDLPLLTNNISIGGKCYHPENPTKNQMILSAMVQKGIKFGIYQYAFGNLRKDTISTLNKEYALSDAMEMFEAVEPFFSDSMKDYKFITFLEDEVEALNTVYNYSPDLMNHTMSCITPHRFLRQLNEKNKKKYHIDLRKQSCGSCYKCAQEYLVLSKYYDKINEGYYNHCIDILKGRIGIVMNTEGSVVDKEFILRNFT